MAIIDAPPAMYASMIILLSSPSLFLVGGLFYPGMCYYNILRHHDWR